MMKYSSHLDDEGGPVCYESTVKVQSYSIKGVRYSVRRMSFGRRMELFQRIREVAANLNFLEASTDLREQVEANVLGQQIQDLYLRWGLVAVEGLQIDGCPATTDLLIESGPEGLAKEIVETIKAQCGLLDEERKN